jgi:hypothetical protein
MLSDSLTGFCNRIGFEEQVDAPWLFRWAGLLLCAAFA